MVTASELRENPHQVAEIIDHTNVDPTATKSEIRTLCEEVLEYSFRSAVVVPYHAELSADILGDEANVGVVIGFPYGVQNGDAKQAEIEPILEYADEIDMVINRTAFANNDETTVVSEITAIKDMIGDRKLKCIIESPELERDEIRHAAQLVEKAGADFVKTAVGYSGPTDPDEVRAIKDAVSSSVEIKASGGIGSFEEVIEVVEAGASRIGASSGVEIVESIQS